MKRCMTQQIFWLRCFLSSEGKRLNHSCLMVPLHPTRVFYYLSLYHSERTIKQFIPCETSYHRFSYCMNLFIETYLCNWYILDQQWCRSTIKVNSFDYNKCWIIFISYFKSYFLHYTWKEIHYITVFCNTKPNSNLESRSVMKIPFCIFCQHKI